jgi:hypothetical protein
MLALEFAHEAGQRMRVPTWPGDQFFGPVGAKNRHLAVAQGAAQVKEQAARSGIGPMQVFEQQQEGALGRKRLEQRRSLGKHLLLHQSRCSLRLQQPGQWLEPRGRGWRKALDTVSQSGITIHRIANGKIAELWAEEDWLGLMHQIGALPASA